MLVSLACFVGLLAAFASVMAQGVKPIRWPWYAAGMLLSASCMYMASREYFGTLRFSIQEAVLMTIGLVLHIVLHAMFLSAEA